MAALTIKNIPRDLHKRLKQSAAQHRRSVNSEAKACLEKALTSTCLDPEEFLARVRAERRRNSRIFVTDGGQVTQDPERFMAQSPTPFVTQDPERLAKNFRSCTVLENACLGGTSWLKKLLG